MIDQEEPDADVRARLKEELEKRVALAQAKARVWTAVAVGWVCLVVIAAIAFGVLVFRAKTEAEHSNGQRITALTAELAEARQQLADSAAVDKETERCAKRYDGAVSTALSEYLASFGDLIVTIGTLADVAVDQRTDVLNAAIGDLGIALAAYQGSLTDRSAWQESGSPLPCPIGAS